MFNAIYTITAYLDGERYEFKTESSRLAETLIHVLTRMHIKCTLYGEVK